MNKNNFQKGFIVPLIIGIVAVLIIAGGVYYTYEKGKSAQVNTLVIPAQAGIQSQTSGSNSSATSTTTQPAPVITSINPSSGPIGTIVELKGNNLAGFEGELSAWIENSNGEKAFLPGIGSVPRVDQTIRVQVAGQLCKENLSYKGGPCSSYMTITPGTYRIYTYPWGNMSNTVQFTVTTSASQINSSQPSITVLSPNGGENWKIGSTQTIKWNITGAVKDNYSLVIEVGNKIIGQENYGTLAQIQPSKQNSYTFTVPSYVLGGDVQMPLNSGHYKVRLTLYDGFVCNGGQICPAEQGNLIAQDDSDNYFTITN